MYLYYVGIKVSGFSKIIVPASVSLFSNDEYTMAENNFPDEEINYSVSMKNQRIRTIKKKMTVCGTSTKIMFSLCVHVKYIYLSFAMWLNAFFFFF